MSPRTLSALAVVALLAPQLPEHSDMEPATLKALVAAGERSALAAMPKLRKLFAVPAA